MEDKEIVQLYLDRSERAIDETQKKYGKYCSCIAANILASKEDAEECVNDTYVRTWNAIPPHVPQRLQTFLGKITRNLALDRYAKNRAQMRSAATELTLNEIADCIPDPKAPESPTEDILLKDALNTFLAKLPKHTRILFLRRYWYLCSVKEIANSMNLTESNVKVTLYRTRLQLKEFLEKEGIEL